MDQITVSAIAREANIDRKTFYVHFGTIDGLLDALAEERVDEILDVMEDALSAASPDMELEVAVAKFLTSLTRWCAPNWLIRYVDANLFQQTSCSLACSSLSKLNW